MNKIKHKIITIPNILSLVRLLLIPVIFYLYCVKEDSIATAIVLVISGLTDTVDGFIARRFNMVSEVGKALDPLADKLTQISVIFCLVTSFPMMIVPLALLIFKEVVSGIIGLLIIKNTKKVNGALWHGKVTTILLYIMMTLHIIWPEIPALVSQISIMICIAMMLLSFTLYTIHNIAEIISVKKEK